VLAADKTTSAHDAATEKRKRYALSTAIHLDTVEPIMRNSKRRLKNGPPLLKKRHPGGA
jgi:hypothetical protein